MNDIPDATVAHLIYYKFPSWAQAGEVSRAGHDRRFPGSYYQELCVRTTVASVFVAGLTHSAGSARLTIEDTMARLEQRHIPEHELLLAEQRCPAFHPHTSVDSWISTPLPLLPFHHIPFLAVIQRRASNVRTRWCKVARTKKRRHRKGSTPAGPAAEGNTAAQATPISRTSTELAVEGRESGPSR